MSSESIATCDAFWVGLGCCAWAAPALSDSASAAAAMALTATPDCKADRILMAFSLSVLSLRARRSAQGALFDLSLEWRRASVQNESSGRVSHSHMATW
jgi:hypothetical protein